ncbi:MAG: hypothetical protein QOE58_898, partial [Actinomycetota bacterium]|nr:hypothetical protein [Actinomycetota bacterium]
MLVWALVSDAIPIYPLYVLLFTDSGMSGAQVSGLFGIWSLVGLVAEVPSGAVADRFSRRGALVAGGLLQACGYAVWILQPAFAGFAIGFVLWGLGGSLVSGAREALLYDGLLAAGAEDQYARISGWVVAAGLIADLPTAVAATVLFAKGGYLLVGWVSVGVCVAAATLAAGLPETGFPETGFPETGLPGAGLPETGLPETGLPGAGLPGASRGADGGAGNAAGYLSMLRAGTAQAAAHPGIRTAVLAVALLGGFDAFEEYFPLVTRDLGVPVADVPLAMVPIALVGALGPALGGTVYRLRPAMLAALLGVSMLL